MVKVMTINDLHFGIDDTPRLYSELHIFKEKLAEYKPDILIFVGDYFDSKLSFTDNQSYYAMMFFNEVMMICKENNIIVRMVQGTRSHDLNQLQAFKSHERDKKVNFRIIEALSDEELLGLKILYIPEEYPEDREFYEEFFKQHQGEYDLVAMHGTAECVEGGEIMAKSVAGRKNVAPVFTVDELLGLLTKRGFVSSGHIHQRSNYKNKILYSGAYTRWRFDDTSDRGFTYFEFEDDSSKFEFILNSEAPEFKTIRLSESLIDPNMPVQDLQKMLDEEVGKTDNLKIDLAGLSKDKIDILKQHFSNNEKVKIEVSKEKTKDVLNEALDEDIKAKFKKYEYITHPSTPLEDRIDKYLKEEKGISLSLELIREILKKGE